MGLLVGQNGAGKSTLLRCIAGWAEVEDEPIHVHGVSSSSKDRAYQKQVVFVPDTPEFYDELTAWEHLQFIAQLNHIARWQDKADPLLQQFQLSEQRHAFPFTYSRGMRYKLALSMALLVQPPLLLLDEPFGPLDALASQTLWGILNDYKTRHGSVLLSTHRLLDYGKPDVIFHLHDGGVDSLPPDDALDLVKLFSHVD